MHHGRTQDAVHRRGGPEPHGRIEIVLAEPGRPAAGVGDARLHADPVARFELGHGRADLDHLARRLVAEDHRLLDDERPDGTVRVVVHVAAAHPDGPQRHPHVARPKHLVDGDVPQLDLVLALQHQRLHVPPLDWILRPQLALRVLTRRMSASGWRSARSTAIPAPSNRWQVAGSSLTMILSWTLVGISPSAWITSMSPPASWV